MNGFVFLSLRSTHFYQQNGLLTVENCVTILHRRMKYIFGQLFVNYKKKTKNDFLSIFGNIDKNLLIACFLFRIAFVLLHFLLISSNNAIYSIWNSIRNVFFICMKWSCQWENMWIWNENHGERTVSNDKLIFFLHGSKIDLVFL